MPLISNYTHNPKNNRFYLAGFIALTSLSNHSLAQDFFCENLVQIAPATATFSAPLLATRPTTSITGLHLLSLQSDITKIKMSTFSNKLQQVIPTGDGQQSQSATLSEAGTALKLSANDISNMQNILNSKSSTGCSESVINNLTEARADILDHYGLSPLDGSQDIVLADYIKQRNVGNDAFAGKKDKADRFNRLEIAYRSMLQSCFSPATGDAYFVNRKLIDRVGIVGSDERDFCSGFLLDDGYVLTAKHCFYSEKSGSLRDFGISKIWLVTSNGKTRREICKNSLTMGPGHGFTSSEDKLVIRVAKTGEKVEKAKITSSIDDIHNLPISLSSPTRLHLYGMLFLAPIISPSNFPSSLVAYDSPGCFVVVKGKGCFTHMCGTTPGASGATIFADSEFETEIAGIHLGTESQQQTCNGIVGPLLSNYANSTLEPEIDPYILH